MYAYQLVAELELLYLSTSVTAGVSPQPRVEILTRCPCQLRLWARAPTHPREPIRMPPVAMVLHLLAARLRHGAVRPPLGWHGLDLGTRERLAGLGVGFEVFLQPRIIVIALPRCRGLCLGPPAGLSQEARCFRPQRFVELRRAVGICRQLAP